MELAPKAIVIGPSNLGATLADLRPEWEFADSVESITLFRSGLSNGSISNDLQAVLISDSLFDLEDENSGFEKLVAMLSPYCLLAVISYSPELRGKILGRVEELRYNLEYPEGKIYFVDHLAPRRTLGEAVATFLREAPAESFKAASLILKALSSPYRAADLSIARGTVLM